jgi:organic radical activating enzyme
MTENRGSTAMMKQIIDDLQTIKSSLPNGEIKVLQTNIDEMRDSQKAMKEDLSDIKKKLLDPNDGVIVKVNENTRFRIQEENRYNDYMKMNVDVQDLKKWQSGINKAMWIVFGALIAIAVKVIFNEP